MRGSFQRRQAEALLRENPALGGAIGMPVAPVAPEVFIHLFKLGNEAGLSIVRGQKITAAAVDAALQAAIRELQKIETEHKEAYLARLTCLRAVYDSGRFDDCFEQTAAGHVFVNTQLLQAMAVAACATCWHAAEQNLAGQFDIPQLERTLQKMRNEAPD